MTMLAAIPIRAWVTLLAAAAIAASLPTGLARWAAEPPYRALPARMGVDASQATRVLDRSGIRWRLEDRGQVLAVEKARFAEAVELIAPSASAKRLAADDEGSRLSRELTQLLASTLGPGKGHVSAEVAVDGDLRRTTSLRYGRRMVRLRETRRRERAAWEGPWRRGRWTRRSDTVINGADMTVRRARHASGRPRTVSAAIVLDRSVRPADARAFRSAVDAAIGDAVGGRVTLSRVDLPSAAGRGAASGPAPLAEGLERRLPWALLLLGTVAFLAQVGASLRRREGDDATPPWLPETSPSRSRRTPRS